MPLSFKYLKLIITGFFITTIGSVFTYVIHDPKIGIDDANITQTYAKNIANGFGYVYNEGGEFVEGSTSLLWTAFNVFFFIIDKSPEKKITIFCFLLTALIIIEALRFLKKSSKILKINYNHSIFVTCGLFLATPSFFAWSIWALMDTTVWILCFTIIIFRSLLIVLISADNSSTLHKSNLILYICFLILPLVRPEGIAISLGLNGLLIFYAHLNNLKNLLIKLLIIISLTIFIFITITIFRFQYFGFPVPNTFYAKVSTSYIDQLFFGLKYLIRYLINPTATVVIILAFSAPIIIYLKNILAIKKIKWLSLLFVSAVFGIFSVYIAVGGDHFGSARQFQILTPLLVVFATLSIILINNLCWNLLSKKKTKYGKFIIICSMVFITSIFTLPSITKYYHDGDGMSLEFRIAEKNRRIGELFNQLPGRPSIGVIIAGGISRTYKGHIYDMMGLNWVEMAHANRLHKKKPKNHSAFDKELFFQTLPDFVIPSIGNCNQPDSKEYTNFLDTVLDGLLKDERFVRNYRKACYSDIVFFVKRNQFDKWGKTLSTPN